MKGETIMNKYTLYAGTAGAMQTAEVKNEKKGGYYVPTKK